MRIKVESCWCGGDKYVQRLTMPNGAREFITGSRWTRATATEALNLLERVYGFTRRAIRFDVH